MKKIFLIIISLFLVTNALADKCYNPDASTAILENDKKPGRFFEDQPDINDDYQIHIVYSLLKYSKDKDKESDINGALEKLIEASDKFILKTTKKGHKKLLKGRKNEWCTYNLHTYAEDDWFKKWKK